MNLAIKDVRYHLLRFISSTFGVSLLIMVVITIGGIIRGVILDSASIIEATGGDLWAVQKNRLGPFVEISLSPEYYWHAIENMPGVAEAAPIVTAWEHVERMPNPTRLMKFMYINTLLGTATMVQPGWMAMPHDQRFVVIGYELGRLGGPPVIVAGRNIEASHYEIVADLKTGFTLGERVRLGNFTYTVVGLTKNMVGFTADPVIYATMLDAENIIFQADPNLFRNERPYAQARFADLAAQNPRLGEPLDQRSAALAGNTLFANAIVVKLRPGASPEGVAQRIARWQHLDVYTAARSVNMQLMGSNRLILFQLSLFRDILILIAGVIIGLIIYTFTLEKLHDIAVLKIIGTPDRAIYLTILQQAIFMGVVGTIVGGALELASEPYFPRRVVATYGDIAQMLVAMIVVAVLASILAVRRATTVDPRSVLGT